MAISYLETRIFGIHKIWFDGIRYTIKHRKRDGKYTGDHSKRNVEKISSMIPDQNHRASQKMLIKII